MRPLLLPLPQGYDAKTQAMMGLFAAQLDDQIRRLKEDVAELTVAQLQWQPRPGHNTVGMLLAHIAIAEVWWVCVCIRQVPPTPQGEETIRRVLGIGMDDDGLPCPPDATHPATLAGKPLDFYFRLLDAARAATHDVLRDLTDADLERTYVKGERTVSNAWTLYHILEHLAAHYGGIGLMKHLMRDAGVLKA